MNISTGMLVSASSFALFSEPEKANHIEVNRPLTIREQGLLKINKYAPCGCGSGKKFKFCCWKP